MLQLPGKLMFGEGKREELVMGDYGKRVRVCVGVIQCEYLTWSPLLPSPYISYIIPKTFSVLQFGASEFHAGTQQRVK